MVRHIKRSAREVHQCHNCGEAIGVMTFHFVKFRSGGRYMSEKPHYRVHLKCATIQDMCCEDGVEELKRFIQGKWRVKK